MHITIDVPETLPRDVVQELLQQFEARLEQEARQFRIPSSPTSKWARIAQEAHDTSPLHGVSEHVMTCSREIRENFAFQHDTDTSGSICLIPDAVSFTDASASFTTRPECLNTSGSRIACQPSRMKMCCTFLCLTLFEFEYSYWNADTGQQSRIRDTITQISHTFDILPLQQDSARIYGEIKSLFKRSTGRQSKDMKRYNIDLLIASTAIAETSIVIGSDRLYRELATVYPQFKTENWFM